jgi:hypothetical protein
VGPLERCLYHRDDIKVLVGVWKWSATAPWPDLDAVLASRVWAETCYEGVRQRLKKPLPVPTITHVGNYYTLRTSTSGDTSVEEGPGSGAAGSVILMAPMTKGAPVPAELEGVKYRAILVELRAGVGVQMHQILAQQLLAGVPALISGNLVYVKTVIQEVEETLGEKLTLGFTHVYERDAQALPYTCRDTPIAVLCQTPLSFPVCGSQPPWPSLGYTLGPGAPDWGVEIPTTASLSPPAPPRSPTWSC